MTGPSLAGSAIPGFADWRRGTVEMVEIGGACGDPADGAPARSVSIEALRHEHGSRRWAGSALALSRLVADERPPAPAGIIFHTGRCGSTLLTDMLAAHRSFRVLNEPDVLNQLLIHQMTAGRQDTGEEELQTLMSAFSRGLDERRLIVKLSSWVAVEGCRIMAALPGVPAIFLWRPAAEVVASCLHTPPAWSALEAVRALIGGPARRAAAHDPLEDALYYARAWIATVTGGLEMARRFTGRVRVCGYEELRRGPARGGAEATAWFGMPATEAPIGAMAMVSRVYSKDQTARIAFDPQGAHARPPLSAPALALVTRLTSPVETTIRELTA
jgi:hypothetical protein